MNLNIIHNAEACYLVCIDGIWTTGNWLSPKGNMPIHSGINVIAAISLKNGQEIKKVHIKKERCSYVSVPICLYITYLLYKHTQNLYTSAVYLTRV